jgi:hypothetical protein
MGCGCGKGKSTRYSNKKDDKSPYDKYAFLTPAQLKEKERLDKEKNTKK